MSGLQDKTANNNKYYKLQQDKRQGSSTEGQYRFFQNEKVNGAWTATNEGNSMSGIIKKLEIKTYEWKGEQKENLELTLGGENADYVISFGFSTGIAENLLNSLINEPILGTVEMNCGQVKNGYPTLYINHNGGKTKWKYSKENNNWNEIPQITTVVDDDGNKIKKGAKARTEFFKKLLTEVQGKLAPISNTPIKDKIMAEKATDPTTNDNSDLPF